jgi:hypothetical protein
MRPLRPLGLALLLVSGGWSMPGSAHHSFAMYDQSDLRTFTGKLTRFIPGANHAQFIFELVADDGSPVLDDAGKPVVWGVETGPAARIAQQGVTPANFPEGTILTLQLNPLRDGRNFGAMPNGTSGIINCGKVMPAGGCTEETGKVYLGQNN